MAPSIVHFFDDVRRLREGTAKLFRIVRADFGEGKIGLKVHFGEGENDTHVRADWLKDVQSIFDEPSFVECNVLYRGHRTLKSDHLENARAHGFGFLDIDILDGERGEASMDVPINIGRTKVAKLGEGLMSYDRLVSVAHFKGHMATGFGGTLKNVGMGLGSRSGKMDMHSVISPYVRSDKCVSCGTCVRDCPVDAILLEGKARIDEKKCIGCAHCIAVCPVSAIDIPWDMSHDVNKILMEKIVEYCLGAAKGRRWWHMNFITGITYDCDCMGMVQKPFMKDLGIVLSQDPVAADQAALDLVKGANHGKDPFLKKHKINGEYMLEYAEKVGLGSRKYAMQPIK
jgi:uncharacterized Fe-S center protein